MVKRYEPELAETTAMYYAAMEQRDNGDYVLFTDYETVERERDFLTQDRDSWRRVAERLESEKHEARRERDALRKTLIWSHSILCTSENCRLDGGPEHEMAFTRAKEST